VVLSVVTWTRSTPLVCGKYGGYWPVASIPHLCRYPPYLSPYFPTSLKTNKDTLESAEGSPVAEFIDASLLLPDRPAFSHRLIALSAAPWSEPDSS
jgi:hypothetical protein